LNDPLSVSNVILFVFIGFWMLQQQMMFRAILESQNQTRLHLLSIEARLFGPLST
jgi:hypothetical protein